jgi:hypothetical protein
MFIELPLQDFKSATTGVAAKEMRNELNKLIAQVENPQQKKVRSRSKKPKRLLIFLPPFAEAL